MIIWMSSVNVEVCDVDVNHAVMQRAARASHNRRIKAMNELNEGRAIILAIFILSQIHCHLSV